MALQPQKEDLLKIGNDGFTMADDVHGLRTRIYLPPPNPIPQAQIRYHHQQYHYQHHRYHYQGPQVVTIVREPDIHQSYHCQQVPQVVTVREPVIHRSYHHQQVPQVVTVSDPVIHQSYHYQQVPQVVTVKEQPVIDSNQAAKLYGGTVIVDYGKRKPARRAS